MDVLVTKHAIHRFRERLFDYSSSEKEIEIQLIKVAEEGKQVYDRPSSSKECFEVKYKDLSIVLVKKRQHIVVLTCLGNSSYRKWVKHQTRYNRLSGRILYPVYKSGRGYNGSYF